MYRLILLLKKIYVLLLFVLLELLSLHFYASSTSYTKARLLTFSNVCVGRVYSGLSYVGHYFRLGGENRALAEEVARLRNELEMFENDPGKTRLPAGEIPAYHHIAARVVSNSVTRQENFFTLNRGMRDEVESDMAVLSPEGYVAGYVLSCSEKFAACISILNTKFRTSGKFLSDSYVGSVYWEGTSTHHVTLSDIPKHAQISKGDTIVTSDYSMIFPAGLLIGTVEEWTLNNHTYTFDVKVKLAADLSALREVVVVRYSDAMERSSLEQAVGYGQTER